MQEVITRLVDVDGVLPALPTELHHFTSLDTAQRIILGDNLRLSHAEYSNDQTEMAEAKRMILEELKDRSPHVFFDLVLSSYEALATSLDAYIFCMSTPRDLLSQWRAYGQDGRGACLTLDAWRLGRLVGNTPGLRINPVIYDRSTQARFVQGILQGGFAEHERGSRLALEATVGALVFATPLMKAPAFQEESEWRLIFMAPQAVPSRPTLGFHARRDFLAPYVDLEHLWNDFRPVMTAIPEVRATLNSILPTLTLPPLVPLTEVRVGPSGHQSLNVRAFANLLIQADRPTVRVSTSGIPYRSLS